MAFHKAGIIKAPSLSLENEHRSLSGWHREEKAFPKLLCFPQELSLAAGQSSQEPPAGMLPSAPTQGEEGARENQLAQERGMEISGFSAEEALRSQHIRSQGATSARGLLPWHSNYFKTKLSSEKAS